MSNENSFIPYEYEPVSAGEMVTRSKEYFEKINRRRSIREFNATSFPIEILENCIRSASSAPSGAHKQPWTFCVISNPEIKKQIREAAEKEEYENYTHRMSKEWLDDLKPFGTDYSKPMLEIAPYLVVVMKHSYELDEQDEKHTNYYVNESVGIAVGFFLAALHNAGLSALTHTPSPMKFLKNILKRPVNETPYLLIPVGLPADNVHVPNLIRKPLNKVTAYY